MQIGAVGAIGAIGSPGPVVQTEPAANAVEGFQNLLADAIQKLGQSQAEADAAVNGLAAGEPLDLHAVALAVEENSLNFQLAMQVRNKLVEAYQEVQRMQV